MNAIAKDMDHHNMPIGPAGRPTEQLNMLDSLLVRLHEISERRARVPAVSCGRGRRWTPG